MRWALRLVEYNFQVLYKKNLRNANADALSRPKTLAETTANYWDEIPSFRLNEKHPERTKIDRGASTVLLSKLHFEQFSRIFRLQHDNDATFNPKHLDDMAPDELFAMLAVPPSADPMFEPISNKRNGYCAISRHLLRRYTPPT